MKIYADESKNNPASAKSENPSAFSDKLTAPTEKEKLKDLHGKKKIQYIWDYYRLPILVILIVAVVGGYTIHDISQRKESVLSVTCANSVLLEDQCEPINEGFLGDFLELDTSEYEVALDTNLMITDSQNATDAQYAYTSRMKLIAYISSGQMDIVMMDSFAFDSLAGDGFLNDLSSVFDTDPGLYEQLKDHIVENQMVIRDNAEDAISDSTVEYEAEYEEHPFALKLNGTPFFPEEEYPYDLYLGIAVNSENPNAAIQYVRYLFGLDSAELDLEALMEK